MLWATVPLMLFISTRFLHHNLRSCHNMNIIMIQFHSNSVPGVFHIRLYALTLTAACLTPLPGHTDRHPSNNHAIMTQLYCVLVCCFRGGGEREIEGGGGLLMIMGLYIIDLHVHVHAVWAFVTTSHVIYMHVLYIPKMKFSYLRTKGGACPFRINPLDRSRRCSQSE